MAAIGGLGFLVTGGGVLVSHGKTVQQIASLREDVEEHGEAIKAFEAVGQSTQAAIAGLGAKLDNLLERKDFDAQLATSNLNRLADNMKAGNDLINSKLDNLKDRHAVEIDQLQHGLRGMRQIVENWKPAPGARPRAST